MLDVKKKQMFSGGVRRDGNFETESQRYLFNDVFPKYPTAAFIDAGANIGLYTVSAAFLGRTVFAFEPVKEYFKALRHSVGVNKLDSNVYLYNYALMEKESGFKIACLIELYE